METCRGETKGCGKESEQRAGSCQRVRASKRLAARRGHLADDDGVLHLGGLDDAVMNLPRMLTEPVHRRFLST